METVDIEQAESADALAQHQGRAIDQGVDVQLSSRHGNSSYAFPDAMRATLQSKIAEHGWPDVITRLKTYRGFGDRSAAVLRKAYDQAIAIGGSSPELTLDVNEKSVFTRIVNVWNGQLSDLL